LEVNSIGWPDRRPSVLRWRSVPRYIRSGDQIGAFRARGIWSRGVLLAMKMS